MRNRSKSLWGLFCVITILGLAGTSQGKSVYAIINHPDSTIAAYDIQGSEIEYQTDTQLDFGSGAVSLALDPNSSTLFTTYDGENYIGLINAKTMIAEQDTVSVPSELAGMVFGEVNSNQRLLAVGRGTTKLFVYIYNPTSKTLTLEGGSYKTLNNLGGDRAFGVALDEQEQRLYVTNKTNEVTCYDTSDDFAYKDKIRIKVNDQDRAAVGIAVYNDGQGNRYLYTGAWSHDVTHDYLVRTYINDPNAIYGRVEKDLGTNATSIAVDQDTGLVYVTTSNGHIEIFDNATFPSAPIYVEDSDSISGPADIVVGSQYKTAPPGLHFDKTAQIENDNTCVSPVDENKDKITYEIPYWNEEDNENEPNYLGPLDVVITDWLSNDVNFVSAEPCDTGQYDPIEHTYTWDITLQPGDKGTLALIVQVRDWADPCGTIANFVEIESEKYYRTARASTGVCCFGGDIIYVDWRRGDPNNGTSWELAYRDLQDALARSAKGCGDEIWVAGGIYKATTPFDMVDDVEIYGGFAGNETTREDRDYAGNKTYLTGDLDSDGDGDRDNIVTAGEAVSSTAVLDGFIITKSTQAGISCDGAEPAIKHCAIIDNSNDGVYCDNADPSINNCVIMDNGGDGIDLVGSSSPSAIKNCWICRNGTGAEGDGIYFGDPDSATVVRNNTIADNANTGVYQHAGTYADISNCIIWGNQGGQLDFDDEYMPTYSCIQDSNDAAPQPPYYNINTNPNFAYTDPNLDDYHLHPDSPCVDAGDPCDTYGGEKDIDGDDRVLNGEDYSPDNGRVDMGADEVACDDIYNSLDWNVDAIVDTQDLVVLAIAWLSYGPYDENDPNTYNWNPDCDLQPETGDWDIDYGDFAVFGADWLWQPCWASSGTGMWMMMGMAGAESMLISETATVEAATQQQISEAQPQAEPSVEEEIAQAKRSLNFWLREDVREGLKDKDLWLRIVTDLEEWLKELEDSQ